MGEIGRALGRPAVPMTLVCQHIVDFNGAYLPSIGDAVWCHRCEDMSRVLGIDTEFRTKCLDCTYARRFGNAPLTAESKAVKHAIARGHRVEIRQGDRLIRKVGRKRGAAGLF